jgi:hypothetical protein
MTMTDTVDADFDQLDHALLSGQLTTDRLAALQPRTQWTRIETHPEILAQPYVVALGTYLEPRKDGLRVIVTLDLASDVGAGDWLHLSVSRERRLPTWGDLVSTRDMLGYEELYFLQQLPPRRYWLNVHPYCLHLLHRLDQDAVPRVFWEGQEGGDGSNYKHGKGAGR